MKFVFWALFALVFSAALCSGSELKYGREKKLRNYGGIVGSPAGEYDYFLLAEIWSAVFCSQHGCHSEECQLIARHDYGMHHFTIHGLWPQFFHVHPGHIQGCQSSDGCAYPESCSSHVSKFDTDNLPKESIDIAPAWLTGLGDHEWRKHGSCANLRGLSASSEEAQQLYFNSTMDLMKREEKIDVSDLIGQRVPAETLYDRFEFDSGIGCASGCQMEAIYTCWSKDPVTNLPKERIHCPAQGVMDGAYTNGCSKCEYISVPEFPCHNRSQKMDII